ncbi:hypothetical protein R3P38DRAFT_3204383 [Favolaschia claudopus]|uniref:Uncharacterized protein n=1 Tax=Favolaschia claudopus TaxID=2862362 RepID=A0AAW0ASA0_9AGAR
MLLDRPSRTLSHQSNSAPTSPDSTIEVDPFTGQKNIAVEVHVLLPTGYPQLKLYDFIHKNLRYFYTVAENSTLLSLIETVVRDMRDSESQWIFGSTSSPIARFLRPHERLELYLLSLVNRGVARSSDGAIMLRKQPFDRGITISDLLGNKNLYAKPFLCIRDSRLIIRLAVAQQGISCLTDHDGEGPVSRHSCLSEFMHSLFSIENDIARDTSRWTPPPCTCTEAGRDIDGESEMDAQELEDLFESDMENLPLTPTPVATASGVESTVELQASIYTKLSYNVVLRACNWSGQTFINKTRLYSAVKLSTERSWKGNPPGPNDTDFDIYQIWLSAKYFWSVEALNIETEPNPASSNESEKAASSLRHEKSWEKIKTAKFRNTYTEAI